MKIKRYRRTRAAATVVVVAAVCSAALVPVASAAIPTATDATSRHTTLKFGACPAGTGAPNGVYCAKLKVPLNYAHPSGKKITLEVSAIGDANAPRAMIVNPGGPGAPGIGTEQYVWSKLPEKVTSQDEVFSFDPRGVGASTPITCGDLATEAPLAPTPYRPRTPAQLRARWTQARKIADSCAAHASRAMLASMNVATEARDMNSVREAVGTSRIDYLGYSGGTDLGATYETMFPSHVGRFLLDSVVDPTVSDYASGYEQDAAFQHRASTFFTWVAHRDKTYHLGTTRGAVEKTWQATRTRLNAHPVAGRVGSSDLDDLLAGALYLASEWGQTAQVVSEYRHGHPSDLERAAKQSGAGTADVGLLAYTCGDPGWPSAESSWQHGTAHAARTSPLFAWLNTWSSAPCRFWPTHVRSLPRIGSVRVPPTLLVNGRHDPATPLIGAERMRRVLTTTRLIVTGGGDHAAYLTDPNTCLDTKATRFWLTGTLPADGTCPVSKGDV